MLTALHRLVNATPSHLHLLDRLLPMATRKLQKNFQYWVDGGSGVGITSAQYGAILAAELEAPSDARVFCYDPLPANFQQMQKSLGGKSDFILRDVALSDSEGEATFVVPYRVQDAGAGRWAAGTSWGGYLKPDAMDGERITVKKIRLQDEQIPRFDFAKLDLQGGELNALVGMGDRISEAKLLYVETQLMPGKATAISYMQTRGFAIFYDRLQFGFKPGVQFLPLETLKASGITIDRIMVPQTSGMPLICWGHFDTDTALDSRTFVLREDHAKRLSDSGVSYLQTDAIGINVLHWRDFAPLLG